jgi:hypothetical protein
MSWAAYLGASWTWCIGMWLPVILLRDLGPWSFVIFALPNCIGAAAMGSVLPTPQVSFRMVQEHAAACRGFSIVTYLFQCYFLAALALGAEFSPLRIGLALAAFLIPTLAGPFVAGRLAAHRTAAAVTLLTSIAMAIWFLLEQGKTLQLPLGHTPPTAQLAGLASVCVLGFALCPYLDLTFHRARQNLLTPSASRTGFTVGFCMMFASMICLTLGYAMLLVAGTGTAGASSILGPWLLPLPLLIHVTMQLSLKVLLHREETTQSLRPAHRVHSWWMVVGAVAMGLLYWFTKSAGSFMGLTAFEFTYRAFMSFYGLVFPAYVWLCMLPLRYGAPAPDRRTLLIYVIAMLAASPFYWIGFMERRYEWTMLGVLIVLAARWFIRPSASPEVEAHVLPST